MRLKHISILFSCLFTLGLSSCSFGFNGNDSQEQYIASLYIAHKPNKTTYALNEAFTLDGLTVISNKTGEELSGYTSSIREGTIFDSVGQKEVVISLTSYKPASFNVEVIDIPSLEIANYPKQIFEYGEPFTSEGLVVKANDEIVTGYSLSLRQGNILREPGDFNVIVEKEGYLSTSYSIHVNKEKTLNISTLPTKTTYLTGEEFSSSGLVIVDENNNNVTDYTLSIEENSVLKYTGDFEVMVTKNGYKSTSFSIRVNENSSIQTKYRDLKIYYINDTHGSFIRQIDGTSREAGMSYIGRYIKDKVSLDPENSLVISGGDMFQGGLESNFTRGDIMIDAMNEIGFDAMVLGNHEFDWGEERLASFSTKLDCGLISSNVFYSSDKTARPSYLEPYKIITRGDLKIGIIGGAQENLGSSITGSISDDFYFPDPVSYVQNYADELRINHNCDVVIAAFHAKGFEGNSGDPSDYQGLTSVSPRSGQKYVDAMLFAHDHIVKQGIYNDVPYMESGCNGRNIAEMTLSLSGTASYSVYDSETEIINAYNNCTISDSTIDALPAKYQEQIGNPDEVIYTFKNTYSSDDFTNVVTDAMLWYVNNNISIFGVHVYFASHNTGGIRANVYAGAFTLRKYIKVFPFENPLCIQTCNSNNIRNMRESSYYRTSEESEIVYDSNNLTKAVTISYIAEYKYASSYQRSYISYPDYTAGTALLAYLRSGVNNNL